MIAILCLLLLSTSAFAEVKWERLEAGLEYSEFELVKTSSAGSGIVHVLRIDGKSWGFRLLSKKEQEVRLTAGEWAEKFGLVATINAGMFQEDHVSNVGYMRSKDTENNRHVNAYKSVFAFEAKDGVSPPRMFDLDVTPFKTISNQYGGIVQNLRLIKRPGENRWSKQFERWSEAALAQDDKGRILFIFMRTPMAMYDFNNYLLGSGLGIQCAHHLEGGLEASFSLRHPKKALDLFGSYEGSLNNNGFVRSPWPIPNVLGIFRK